MRPDICPTHKAIIADGQPCLFSDCVYGPESLIIEEAHKKALEYDDIRDIVHTAKADAVHLKAFRVRMGWYKTPPEWWSGSNDH